MLTYKYILTPNTLMISTTYRSCGWSYEETKCKGVTDIMESSFGIWIGLFLSSVILAIGLWISESQAPTKTKEIWMEECRKDPNCRNEILKMEVCDAGCPHNSR